MSDDEELLRSAEPRLAPVDPVPDEGPYAIEAPAPRVRWIAAAALHLVAGGIVGFLVPFIGFALKHWGSNSDFTVDVVWVVISLISAALVGLIGGGIPLLAAWGSWLIVSRRRRRLRREVLAVVLGAIGGGLIASVPAFLYFAASASPLPIYAVQVLLLGGIPALAFALWVAAAWHRARKALANSPN